MKRILSAKGIREKLKKLAKEIAKKEGIEDLVFIGIKRRGDILARRLAGLIKKEKKIEVGAIDITFYRDDLDLASPAPIVRGSEINFSLNDKVCHLHRPDNPGCPPRDFRLWATEKDKALCLS